LISNIYVICGYGSCDIGKGWLTSALSGCLNKSLVIKIDPFLNMIFPKDLGIEFNGQYISDDFSSYKEAGIDVYSEANILNGQVISDIKILGNKMLSRGSIKKLTFSDISELLAKRLINLLKLKKNLENIIIEIGGSINDREHIWIPDALKLFGNIVGKMPELLLLSYLEHAEAGYKIKTQSVRNAIRCASSIYKIPIRACFIRRRYLPENVSNEEIYREFFNISFETQFPVNKLILEDNYNSISELRNFMVELGISNNNQAKVFVSSCLLSHRCRYNGKGKILNTKIYKELLKYDIICCCPEVLAGLGIPRLPIEIVGGDGLDFLNGNAKAINVEGKDISNDLLQGCKNALELIKKNKILKFYLCDKSPSCGSEHIYDGKFTKNMIKGVGVFTALLIKHKYKNIVSVTTEKSS
jgi:uncharacterized protein YbbK (DUF523 family)